MSEGVAAQQAPAGRLPSAAVAPGVLVGSAIGFALLQAAHLLLRKRNWAWDVPFAVMSYLFSMIFYGPAAAGVGAWQGRRFAETHWLARARPLRTTASFLGPALGTAWGIFGLGLVSVVLTARRGGSLLVFEGGVGWDVLIALLAIAGYMALGFAVGVWWPSVLAAPLMAAGSFGLTMAGWIGGYVSVLRFGGGSLGLGTPFSAATRLLRLITFAGLSVACTCVAARRARRTGARPGVWVGIAALAAGVVWGTVLPYDKVFGLDPSLPPVVCAGDAPRICMAPRAARSLPAFVALSRESPARELANLIIASPHAMEFWYLGLRPVRPTRTPKELAAAVRELAESVQSIYAPGCFYYTDIKRVKTWWENFTQAQRDAMDRMGWWVRFVLHPPDKGMMEESNLLRRLNLPLRSSLSSPETREFVLDNLAVLPPCR